MVYRIFIIGLQYFIVSINKYYDVRNENRRKKGGGRGKQTEKTGKKRTICGNERVHICIHKID